MPLIDTETAPRRGGRPSARAAEIARIEAELKPIDEDVLLDLLSDLSAGLPPRDARDIAGIVDQRVTVYMRTLQRYSEATLRQMADVIMDGRAPELDARYLPTPPEMARLCRKIDAPKHAAIGRLRGELELLNRRSGDPPAKKPEPGPTSKPAADSGATNSGGAEADQFFGSEDRP